MVVAFANHMDITDLQGCSSLIDQLLPCRLLHDPFISSNVGPTNNSGVRVSTLSWFITNAEKSRGVSISSLIDSPGSSIWAKVLSQG
ncbi:hypothetical protein Tco_1199205 [Tanacetum coccineum]